ncbi:hypothetical protein ALC57_08800 [Trachymyrmex cornetzi]|uniref:YqaJ viral recombinase domain-containing protein n=1 Tax=Trachymyrmex cornetzi TaxID=471704 RepID=A0A151J6R9_9HYME|nr:hypothetical protein ALC57_08800 [Trachymyrmex cornetzi]
MRPTTSCAATVKNILYPPLVDTAAMKYGRDREEVAKEQLAAKLNKEIKSCGLFIDSENPCLGCTPDGLIDEDGVVEIKCPQSAEHLTVEKAVETLAPLRAIFNKKDPEKMNRNHKYFYQIQGQLNITKRDYCVFTIWTPKSMKIIHVNKDNAFWKKKMLLRLIRFYYECMLPEIVDNRYNKNMPIRDPGYILQAQGDAAKKINRKKRTYSIESDNAIEEKKCKSDISLTETAIPAAVDVVKIEQDDDDDDCVIISYDNEYYVTEADMARQRKFLDDNIPSLSSVKENVLPTYSKLNDESLDRFLRVVRETSSFETQSVLYLKYPHIIQASHSDKSIQIIGGNCTDHWRCIYFDGIKLHVYDSIPGCTYNKLAAKEKNYIHLRYPNVKPSDIIFEKVVAQPDGTCCGIYAAAFATTVALGGNPCNEKYCKNVKCMRQHFTQIIESNKLIPFPYESSTISKAEVLSDLK